MSSEPGRVPSLPSMPASAGSAQFEIQLSHLCNNRCVFCASGLLTEKGEAGPVAAGPVLSELEAAWRRGERRVTFLGGEPTIQPAFLPALRHAVALGFPEIVIFTNGVRGPNTRFLDEVLALGSFEWRFSIQGGDEETHDRVTGKPGSFARILSGMEYLKTRGQRITVNMCVNTLSYVSLPHYPELVRAYGVKQLHVDMVRPADAGRRTDEHLRSIMPRFSDMAPSIESMLEGFERWDPGFDVNVGNYPFCLSVRWAHRIHHDGETTLTVSSNDGGTLSVPKDKYAWQRSDKVHPAQCAACVFRPSCRGVAEKYIQFYGTDEFHPVSREDLAAADPDQRFFTQEVAPYVTALAALPAAGGYRVEGVREDSRERRVEVSLLGHAGVPASITLAPVRGKPVSLRGAFYRDTQLRAGFEGGAAPSSPTVNALIGAARGALARVGAAERLRSLHRRAIGVSLGGGWACASGSRESATQITYRHDGGGCVDLVLTDEPKIQASFTVKQGTERAAAEALIERVRAALGS